MEKLYRQVGDDIIEFTDAEYAQVELDKIEAKRIADEIAIKDAAKAALLVRLKMTEDEAKLLLG